MRAMARHSDNLWEWLREPYQPTAVSLATAVLLVVIVFLVGWVYGGGAGPLFRWLESFRLVRPP